MLRILVLPTFLVASLAGAQSPDVGPQKTRGEGISRQAVTLTEKDVWRGEVNYFRYLRDRNLKDYMALWDDHFAGWPDYMDRPAGKREIEAVVEEEFRVAKTPTPPIAVPTPEKIAVFGDVAVTHYFWPDPDESSRTLFRITHTWQRGTRGWHIIGGMSCEVPRQAIRTPDQSSQAAAGVPDAGVSKRSQADDIAAVREQEEAFRKAELNYDRAAAKELLDEEFVGSGNNGEVFNKDQFVVLIGDKEDPLEALEYGELDVRVYGDTAVVRSTIHERAVYGGKPDEYRGRRTAVWAKRDNRWQCVTMHTSASEENGKKRQSVP